MADIDVTLLPAYSTPTSSDVVIVIKDADSSLNNTTIGQLLGLVSVPSAYTSNPAALGTASPGSSNNYSRGDHVHPMPTAANVGAIAAPSSPATGAFLVWSGSAWVAQTLSAWQGGSY